MTALAVVGLASRAGARLGVFASEAGAKACAEAEYRQMRAFYGEQAGSVRWEPRERMGQPDVQALYATHPGRLYQPDDFGCMDEIVIRCEVQP